ncbi:mucin-2-like [Diorhabda carinulata]|uniref:mucin-2-like n=1 Tax=Diorhabda carinulata TaxID=1163345 RepID=UPI0025A1F87E|nr:mucin-2-like [Diorhabda carinulata]
MMNSTLKPVLPTTQTTSPTPNKPMHPQGAPVSYGQPSGPIPQNPFPNTNVAHNSASQQNHFSLSGSPPFNMGSIPASNHPVAISQPSSGQVYNQPKNVSYSSGFQNAQNQNTLPPVSQALPATTPLTTAPNPIQNTSASISNSTTPSTESSEEKLQPNGTTQDDPAPEVDRPNIQENHVTPEIVSTEEPKQDTASPSPSQEKTPEEPSSEPLNNINDVDAETSKESDKEHNSLEPAPVPEPSPSPVPVSASTTTIVSVPITADVPETSSTSVSEPVESSTLKEDETETVQNDSVSSDVETSKETIETDPLAIETPSDMKLPHDQDKNVLLTESKDEGSEDEEQSSDGISDSEKCEKDEDPLRKTPKRKTKALPQEQKIETKSPMTKTPSISGQTKRQRIMTQHYQSPLPEIEIITKISSSTPRTKNNDDKLIYFYKNEFLAVRNTEGGFYLCQAVQNIYKSSSKIKIRWLSQDKSDKSGEIYTPDFYDLTDFDCILTSIDLTRVGKGRYKLKPKEKERTDSILKRCLAVEKGEISQPSVSEEHPDGLDISLYKDEEQLVKNKNRGTKRKSQPRMESPKKHVPIKKTPETPKVRKVETKPTKNSASTKKVTPAKKLTAPEPKKTPTRGKRKSDSKASPVVDPKKAKVLARIGRKTAVTASNSKPQAAKSGKVSKPTPSTSKVTKTTPASSKTPPRKAAKRSSRK